MNFGYRLLLAIWNQSFFTNQLKLHLCLENEHITNEKNSWDYLLLRTHGNLQQNWTVSLQQNFAFSINTCLHINTYRPCGKGSLEPDTHGSEFQHCPVLTGQPQLCKLQKKTGGRCRYLIAGSDIFLAQSNSENYIETHTTQQVQWLYILNGNSVCFHTNCTGWSAIKEKNVSDKQKKIRRDWTFTKLCQM